MSTIIQFIHIHIYIHIHTYTYIYIHIHTYTYIYIHIHNRFYLLRKPLLLRTSLFYIFIWLVKSRVIYCLSSISGESPIPNPQSSINIELRVLACFRSKCFQSFCWSSISPVHCTGMYVFIPDGIQRSVHTDFNNLAELEATSSVLRLTFNFSRPFSLFPSGYLLCFVRSPFWIGCCSHLAPQFLSGVDDNYPE